MHYTNFNIYNDEKKILKIMKKNPILILLIIFRLWIIAILSIQNNKNNFTYQIIKVEQELTNEIKYLKDINKINNKKHYLFKW